MINRYVAGQKYCQVVEGLQNDIYFVHQDAFLFLFLKDKPPKWTKGIDYFRMDGSTNAQQRKHFQDTFNDPNNKRYEYHQTRLSYEDECSQQ